MTGSSSSGASTESIAGRRPMGSSLTTLAIEPRFVEVVGRNRQQEKST